MRFGSQYGPIYQRSLRPAKNFYSVVAKQLLCAPENASTKMLAYPALLFVTVVGHATLISPS